MNRKPENVTHYLQSGCGRCERWNTANCSVIIHNSVLLALINLLRSTTLKEEIKWNAPCYTYNGKNVAIVGAFRDYCVLSFFKGALLHDPKGLLVKPGENTQVGRVIRFTDTTQVEQHREDILYLIAQAIQLESSVKKVTFKQNSPPEVEEFTQKLESVSGLKKAFYQLTPGRQKAYLLYFAEPKTPEARLRRIEKCIPLILQGKGLYDKYKAK
ncbi:MAG: YdeI/OmpD-associated family protein [Thermaurantimonas sp.]|uniref:YdhG-like domain-containing protein n=1 Tax=Thermaurantimonas aggregans TaxID=2173829 RepID=A0A401XJH7_9FLAO|nr:DUF1801 domain-containing protein [Thermaurantimonas aggregans]MCX8148689.1 DUF1801 domain-containing protein [Thermaurantimonas aggregans]GCD77153.1 hypothetical protein JCM31826_06350 [Thermaurantimonas aggregans]